jgi:hypothetical protein
MAPPKLETRLKGYSQELARSRRWREKDEYEKLWKRMIDLYRGRHYDKVSKSDRALINVAFSTKNVIAPSVAVNNPKFTVNARKPESFAQAVVTEEVLNYLWRTYRYQADFRLAVDDFLSVGHGWVKVAYKAKKQPVIKTVEGEGEGVDDRDETVPGNVESELTSFDADRPFVERVSPFDIFVDPDARHPKEMRWIAQRTRRLVADVRVDSRYSETVRKQVNGQYRSRWSNNDGDGRDAAELANPGSDQYVDIIELYDLRRNEMCTFAEMCEDGFLIKPQPMVYPFGQPFVMLRNYEVPDHFYPMGELEAIESLQHELNETRTQMIQHRKRFARKWLYLKDFFDDQGIAALESDEDNVMVPIEGETNLNNAVVAMPSIGTPPDFYNQSELITQDIDRVTGVSDYMRGDTANIRRTATEAAMIQDAQNSRAADKLSRIEMTLADIGGKLIQLMQVYMTGEHVVRIVGGQNPVWVQFDADYIQGEFDFEVEAGSTQPRNESFRRQSALQLVDALGPFIQLGVVNPQALAQYVLQFGFGVKNVDAFMQMDPMGMGGDGDPSQAGPPMQPQSPQVQTPEESPVAGIPAELIRQLEGATGFDPAPQ